jgi:hypothetical protein
MLDEQTKQAIEMRMKSVAWIRECSAKLLRLDSVLRAPEPQDYTNELRRFFVERWHGGDNISILACFNTFASTADYVEAVLKAQRSFDLKLLMHVLAQDIEANLYSVWIYNLCATTKPVVVPASSSRAPSGARPLALSLPVNPWTVTYTREPLLRELETLYARYMPLMASYSGGEALVRLNGEPL